MLSNKTTSYHNHRHRGTFIGPLNCNISCNAFVPLLSLPRTKNERRQGKSFFQAAGKDQHSTQSTGNFVCFVIQETLDQSEKIFFLLLFVFTLKCDRRAAKFRLRFR